MASGTLVEGGRDLPKNRWIENKVYTRKCFKKGIRKPIESIDSQPLISSQTDGNLSSQSQQQDKEKEKPEEPSSRVDLGSDDSTNIQQREEDDVVVVIPEKGGEPEPPKEGETPVVIKKSSVQTTESHVNIDVAAMSKQEIREVKLRLVDELEQVRSLLVEVRAKESEIVVGNGDGDGDGVDVAMDDGSDELDELGLDGCVEVAVEVADVLDGYNPSQLSSSNLVDNGGIRSLASDTYYANGGSRRKISEVSLGKVHSNGIISVPDAHLDNGCPRLTTPEVSMDYGGDRRMNPEVSFDNGSGRMFPSTHLDGVTTGRMIPVTTLDSYGGRRMISEVNSFGKREHPRSFNQLRVSVMENSHTGLGEYVEKEKRTPKANSYYQNSDFIVGKEKLPSHKKLKTHGKKHSRAGERGYGFSMIKHSSPVFKHCGALLSRLLKHKHGWVFNAPVDVEGLGLHDYYLIIKHPMDLGTVKTRLNANWYKTPREFAEDVRLTFHNAMTYNPKGQDVHFMAEQLSQIFEERWGIMETEYNLSSWFELYHDMNFSPAGTNKAPHMYSEVARNYDRVDTPQPIQPKPRTYPVSARVTALKKPKAKDMNKREMTYDEKQKLSTQLQALPTEKLDNIVEIIKRRNTSLLQHDDEIEVDIDSVDTETLWELDRFVTNFKKSLSKYKRKQELATRARAETERIAREKGLAPSMGGDVLNETRIDENNAASRSPHQADNQQGHSSRSSSSSSSSSDSSSSSSDSDSDSSSESEAGGNSPRVNVVE